MAEETLIHDGKAYTEEQLINLTNEIKDYQINHGSLLKVVQYETESSVPARPVGVSILPTPFPKRCYDEAMDLQSIFNELYIRVAADPDWLYSVLGGLMKYDALVSALWNVHTQVKEAGRVQNFVCGVFRSDYMLHQPTPTDEIALKQVEFNTFSCAGIAHAQRIAKMHHHLSHVRNPTQPPDPRLPQSQNIESIVSLLKAAHEKYTPTTTKPLSILMPVQPFNFNTTDERPIEQSLWESGIPCYRCEWLAALTHTTLTPDRTLLYRPPLGPDEVEVSVVYYRAGYAAEEYRDQGMKARVRLEISRAIKCPDILTNLTNFKAVQAALAAPGALERFIAPEKAARVRETFMYLQVLDTNPAGLAARATAKDEKAVEGYVLKPNLEGGGHNVYGSSVPGFLARQPEEAWGRYTLMELITPPKTEGLLMMPHDLYHGGIVSELGMWGTCLWERSEEAGSGGVEMVRNEVGGWTFKSKPEEVEEMSVVKGYGCFDCPLLVY